MNDCETCDFKNMMPKWIPCSKEMPEPQKYVLVTMSSDFWYDIMIMAFCIEKDDDGEICFKWRSLEESIEYAEEDVIAWMPLPYHYQEDRV